jgi:hypothetical protein
MINWARILLHNTTATVHANGVESSPRLWHAGVRQGCPLSPLLYLFIAQSLAAHLRAQPLIGVVIDGYRHVSKHHADDAHVHLSDLSEAAQSQLEEAFETFSDATGQTLNIPKSVATFVGAPLPSPAPAFFAGISVRQEAISLGILRGRGPRARAGGRGGGRRGPWGGGEG